MEKNITIEDKAKAYDEAIEIAKEINNEHKAQPFDVMLKVFPELQESDDEKIRKELIQYLKDYPNLPNGKYCRSDFFNWIEKQYEKPQGKSALEAINEKKVDNQNCIKPTDKVKSKFKIEEGKWYVCIKDLFDSYANKAFYKGDTYLSTQDGSLMPSNSNVPFEVVCPDVYFRDWTIQDAKDGDVLVADNGSAFIYNGYLEEQQWPFAYGGINIYGRFNICDDLLPFTHQKVVPATKEQRDSLMKAMADAGYTFDFDKKELKEIEHNPAWSEEDEINYNYALAACKYYGEVKGYADTETHQKTNNWLKYLKERYTWKPSNEQIGALEHFVRSIGESGFASPYENNTKLLYSLLEQLKKLKE